MSQFDLVIIIITLFIIIIGYARGILLELFLLLKWVGAIIFAWIFYKPVALSLQTLNIIPNFDDFIIDLSSIILIGYQIIAFIGLWFLFRVIIGLLTFMFRVNRKFDEPKQFIRVLGGIYGGAKAYILIFIIALLAHLPGVNNIDFLNSKILDFAYNNTPIVSALVTDKMDALASVYDTLQGVGSETEDMGSNIVDLIESGIVPAGMVVETIVEQLPEEYKDRLFKDDTLDLDTFDEYINDPENVENVKGVLDNLNVSDEVLESMLEFFGVPQAKRLEIINKLK